MAKKSDIIKTLQRLTKVEAQGDDESRQEYLERLATAGSESLEDDVWESLPKATQLWVNAAVKALNAGKEITDPDEKEEEPEADEPEEETEESEDTEEEGEEENADDQEDDSEEQQDDDNEENDMTGTETKASSKKGTAKKKAPAKKKVVAKKVAAPKKAAAGKDKSAKKAATRGNGAVRGTGAQTVIKQIMLKDPGISTEDLMSRLEKKGLKPTKVAVTSIRSGMRHTLKVMADAGVLHSSIKLGKEA